MRHWAFALSVILALILTAPASAKTLPELVSTGNDSLLTVRLQQGVDPNEVWSEYYGGTALMLAAERNDPELMRQLLRAGADPDARDRYGDTALNWAVYYGFEEATEVLLAANADLRLTGHGNALQIALRRGHDDLARRLAEAMGQTRPLSASTTRLLAAATADDAEAVVREVHAGADPRATDDLGRPLLHVAALRGCPRAAAALLESGEGVDAVDPNGMTALMVAAREAQTAVVELLLERGADVQWIASPHANQLQPLHCAAIGGMVSIIAGFVAAGAELDVQDADGMTPLFWALAEGKLPAAVALIGMGADPALRNLEGDSVASVAEQYEIKPILRAIRSEHAGEGR